jgi:hypothetical protein
MRNDSGAPMTVHARNGASSCLLAIQSVTERRFQAWCRRTEGAWLERGGDVELSIEGLLEDSPAPALVIEIDSAGHGSDASVLLVHVALGAGSPRSQAVWDMWLGTARPIVVFAGLGLPNGGNCLPGLHLVEASRSEITQMKRGEHHVAVVVAGPELSPLDLDVLHADWQMCGTQHIVSGIGEQDERLQVLVDRDQVFYAARGVIQEVELCGLILQAVQTWASRYAAGLGVEDTSVECGWLEPIVTLAQHVARQPDLRSALNLLATVARDTITADEVSYLLYDSTDDALWGWGTDGEPSAESAAAGLAAYVCRTGSIVRLAKASADSRYDPSCDNPRGEKDDRLLILPVCCPRQSVAAVLLVRRDSRRSSFSQDEEERLRLLVKCAEAGLQPILLSTRLRKLRRRTLPKLSGVYRDEAIEAHFKSHTEPGRVLEVLPVWLEHSSWVVIGLLLLFIVTLAFARTDEYAKGTGVVMASERTLIVAHTAGTVRAVDVLPGYHVKLGDSLVRLHETAGLTERQRLIVSAPVAGVVADVRVRQGQAVQPGDVLATLFDRTAGYDLVAFLPGQLSPRINAGMRLQFRLSGYPEVHTVDIDRVTEEIVSPTDIARSMETTDTLVPSGPSVMVRAHLRGLSFQTAGRNHDYTHGLRCDAELKIGSETVLEALVPGLKGVSARWVW